MYCRSGRRSALAVEAMKKLGYADLTDLGGMDEAKKRLRKGSSHVLTCRIDCVTILSSLNGASQRVL